MVEQQPGISREVSNDMDAIEEAEPHSQWALAYIQKWTLASSTSL